MFCERVAFIFDIMVFLAHQYIGETMATATKNTLMDQLAEIASRNPFFRDKRVENDLGARVQGFVPLTESH